MHSRSRATSRPLTRRTVLCGAALGTAAGLLATCASGAVRTPAVFAQAPTSSVGGTLRIAVASFPNTLDALKETNVLRFGIGETLMRLSPSYEVQPWLAERVDSVDPLTWQIKLRANARFHDNSPVTATDVVDAFRRNYAAYPNGDALISQDSTISALDPSTVQIKTPAASGSVPNALTSSNFIIHKPSAPGASDGSILTGPYRPVHLTVDSDLSLERFADHWSGVPPLAGISVRKVADPNTEVLALQTGETDLIFRVPPEIVRGLGPDFSVASIPSGIVDSIELNLTRPPLDDHAVREALAWGIDRSILVTVALDGQGAPATGVFPPNIGVDAVATQGYDVERAAQVLDTAGWTMASDGVRSKAGRRLAFTLLDADATQAELVPMSVSIQSQLKPLGFDITLQQTQDYAGVIKTRDFDALIVSFNSVQTGDPLFQLARAFGRTGGLNWGNYQNQHIDELLTQLRAELDPDQRQAISRQIQTQVGSDIPAITLAVAPIVSAYRTSRVMNFTPHPDDTYLIDSSLAVLQ